MQTRKRNYSQLQETVDGLPMQMLIKADAKRLDHLVKLSRIETRRGIFKFKDFTFDRNSFAQLMQFVRTSDKLQALCFHNCSARNSGVLEQLAGSLAFTQTLKTVELSGRRGIITVDNAMLTALCQNSSVTTLIISRPANLSADCLMELLLTPTTNLVRLDLLQVWMSNEQWVALMDCLAKDTKIKHLALESPSTALDSRNLIADEICDMISQNTAIACLDLRTRFGNMEVCKLFMVALAANRGIRNLTLLSNQSRSLAYGDYLQNVAEMLVKNGRILRLNIVSFEAPCKHSPFDSYETSALFACGYTCINREHDSSGDYTDATNNICRALCDNAVRHRTRYEHLVLRQCMEGKSEVHVPPSVASDFADFLGTLSL